MGAPSMVERRASASAAKPPMPRSPPRPRSVASPRISSREPRRSLPAQAPMLIAMLSGFCLVVATGLVLSQMIIMMLGRIGDTPTATSGRGRTYALMCNLGLYLSVPVWCLALMFYLATRIVSDDDGD